MGATTTISVFHHDRYRSCVVPAVRQLLRSGELGPWLQAVWDHRQSRYPATVGRPFEFEPNGNDERMLDDELLATPAAREWFYLPGRGTRERQNVIDLFHLVVEGCCLGESTAIVGYHWPDFMYEDFPTTPALASLLRRLCGGAGVWDYRGRDYAESVRGWVTPLEVAALARELHQLELPDRPPDPSLLNADPPSDYYHHGLLHSLFGLRWMADQAWELGHGVLLSGRLELPDDDAQFTTPHPAYSTDTVQQLARAIRDRREFDVLPVLADALQEAGCENDVVLAHCRDANEHTDACWVADLILANEPPS